MENSCMYHKLDKTSIYKTLPEIWKKNVFAIPNVKEIHGEPQNQLSGGTDWWWKKSQGQPPGIHQTL